jgi:uncharacterized Zn finger protein (UPF0148 family)
MSELKPCPFCGGTVGWKSGEINCIACGLRFRKRSSYEGNNEAWNERTHEQRIAELEAERDEWKELYDSVLEGRNHWSDIAGGIYRRFYPRGEYCMPNDPTDMINKAIEAIERERDEWKAKAEAKSAKRAAAAEQRIAELENLVRDMHAWFTGGDEYCDTCELSARCDEDYGDDCGMRTVFEGRMSALGIEVD